MAEEITCPACETPNDPWNELCEACGADLHADDAAPVQDDATDGDEFVEPHADGEPGGFEGVEEVQAYDDDNPDYGVVEDIAAHDEPQPGEYPPGMADDVQMTVEYNLAEDTGAYEDSFSPEETAQQYRDQGESAGEGREQIAGHEVSEDHPDDQQEDVGYELEVIEPEDEAASDEAASDEAASDEAASDEAASDEAASDEAASDEADEDQWDDEQRPSEDDQFDGGAPLEGSPDDTFDSWAEDDEVAADGGVPLAAETQLNDQLNDPFDDGLAEDTAESEVDEELPPPPELEAILNPQQVDRTPIEPLPTPGPYTELASLTVMRDGQRLGEVAIDFNCTVLGLDRPDEAQIPDDDEALYELEAIEPVEAPADQAAGEDQAFEDAPYELEAIEDESPEPFDLDESSDLDGPSDFDEPSDWDIDDNNGAYADSEVDEEPEAAATHDDPESLEEGPVIDLSQFGDHERFSRRHGYVFRQNKHYTLYVLSDMGTQVNDELLELGEYRELADGDVIVLGGEVALKFNKPAA